MIVSRQIKQTRDVARACFIRLCCVVYFLPLPPDDLPPPFAVLLLRPPPDLLPVWDGLFCGYGVLPPLPPLDFAMRFTSFLLDMLTIERYQA